MLRTSALILYMSFLVVQLTDITAFYLGKVRNINIPPRLKLESIDIIT